MGTVTDRGNALLDASGGGVRAAVRPRGRAGAAAGDAVAFALAFFAAGFAYELSLLLVLCLAGGAVVTRRRRVVVALIGAGIGLALIVAAPGNAVRASLMPERQPLHVTAQMIGVSVVGVAVETATTAPEALALLWALGVLVGVPAPTRRGRLALALAAVTLAAMAVALLPYVYATSSYPYARAQTLARVVLALAVFVGGALCRKR